RDWSSDVCSSDLSPAATSKGSLDSNSDIIVQFLSPLQRSPDPHNLQFARRDLSAGRCDLWQKPDWHERELLICPSVPIPAPVAYIQPQFSSDVALGREVVQSKLRVESR